MRKSKKWERAKNTENQKSQQNWGNGSAKEGFAHKSEDLSLGPRPHMEPDAVAWMP